MHINTDFWNREFTMESIHYISSKTLTIAQVVHIIENDLTIDLSEEAKGNINRSRNYLDEKLRNSEQPIYGINTGFGSLCNVKISEADLSTLQENLVKSHACGLGKHVPLEVIQLMLLFKIQSLSYGNSGVAIETVERLVQFYNSKVYPVVYDLGSLGASGDLAPLAHLVLPLFGEGSVWFDNKIYASAEINARMGWEPIRLQSKEGLALLNGTQFMVAYGVYAIIKSSRLNYLADLVSAMSLDAFNGRIEPFHELIHLARPHKGQIETAARVRSFLSDSIQMQNSPKQVQDPYSFRCIPQVHGASKDVLDYVKKVFKTELNSVTDNPNIFVDEDLILSGGNFHGQPLAMALDFLAISISELGSISERRIFQLISGLRELPAFLVGNPGLNSGFMIPQYTAAAIASKNKQLATPASVDSIVSSNGQEDHVSMGANAAVKTLEIIENVERILAIELFNASQALLLRKHQTGNALEAVLRDFRTLVPKVENDIYMHEAMVSSVRFIRNLKIDESLYN